MCKKGDKKQEYHLGYQSKPQFLHNGLISFIVAE